MTTPLRLDASQREDDDHQLYERLVRDVCYFYHKLSDYGEIVGDLDYANDYPLPYWRLINRVDTGRGDDRFIRSGILMLLMAMIHDQLDGSGDRISDHVNDVTLNLQQFVPEDGDMLRLCDAVLHGLAILDNPRARDDRFDTDSAWSYDAFVRRYFQNYANL